jgi:hypothetical protein
MEKRLRWLVLVGFVVAGMVPVATARPHRSRSSGGWTSVDVSTGASETVTIEIERAVP